MSDHGPSLWLYLIIYVILMALVGATVAAAFVNLGPFNILTAMVIASVKAVLVVLYFMHVRYEKGLAWLIALGSTVWLALLIVITLGDYLTRGWS